MLNLIFNFKSCHISNYAALHVDEPQQSWDVLLEEPLHLAGVRWIMKLNDWFPMFPHRFGSSVWHTHLKTLETLTLTLGLPHTHTHTVPVREQGSYIGVRSIWHSPAWDRESGEVSGGVGLSANDADTGSSRSSASILGRGDTTGTERPGQWANLESWTEIKGKIKGKT